MSAYYCEAAADHPLHKLYHDQEYGFPLDQRQRPV